MKFERLEIPDLILYKPDVFKDERGYFLETFRLDKFSEFLGEKVHFCQENESKSAKGIIRGLHYQKPPFAQAKLVRVVKGRVLDVVVDMRKDSPTFGKHVSVELNDKNKIQLFVPRGFAHGFIVLSDDTIFAYKVDNYYHRESECGVLYSDSELGINWGLPNEDIVISEKDRKLPLFRDAEYF